MNAPPAAPTLFEKIAKVCHEAHRAWSEANGDQSNVAWEAADEPERSFAIDAVKQVLAGAEAPQVHESWRSLKLANGWTYGPTKDPVAKTTPHLVPFDLLPDLKKRDNDLLVAVARTLGCGTERWDVKTLTDSAASQVNLTPQASTVADLIALARPGGLTAALTSRMPEEFNTYQVTGTITLAKLESDSDVHMVLTDGASNTMIVEAVCPTCAQNSVVATQIAAVRDTVQAQFPTATAGGIEHVSVPATVTGVAFFDHQHGQDGVAPNAIELHPVLSLRPSALAPA
jgi:RyR domain